MTSELIPLIGSLVAIATAAGTLTRSFVTDTPKRASKLAEGAIGLLETRLQSWTEARVANAIQIHMQVCGLRALPSQSTKGLPAIQWATQNDLAYLRSELEATRQQVRNMEGDYHATATVVNRALDQIDRLERASLG